MEEKFHLQIHLQIPPLVTIYHFPSLGVVSKIESLFINKRLSSIRS